MVAIALYNNCMSMIGIGRKLFLITLPYSVLAIYLHFNFYPYFAIRTNWIWFVGVVLIIAGLLFLFRSVRSLFTAIHNDELATTGPYSIFANPIYAAWILLIIPGMSFFIYSWALLTSSIVMYICLRLFIRDEEDQLRENFGAKYDEYRKRVLIKFL